MQIVKVTASRVSNGYRYHGHTQDGEVVVLRKLATKLYKRAFYYPFKTSSCTTGLAAHFRYGAVAKAEWSNKDQAAMMPTKVFDIEEAA